MSALNGDSAAGDQSGATPFALEEELERQKLEALALHFDDLYVFAFPPHF